MKTNNDGYSDTVRTYRHRIHNHMHHVHSQYIIHWRLDQLVIACACFRPAFWAKNSHQNQTDTNFIDHSSFAMHLTNVMCDVSMYHSLQKAGKSEI
jgi:hypothetical protein